MKKMNFLAYTGGLLTCAGICIIAKKVIKKYGQPIKQKKFLSAAGIENTVNTIIKEIERNSAQPEEKA